MTENGHQTTKQLARNLGKPYRTIKSLMKLLGLSEPAKQLLREAGKDPLLRPRLTRAQLAAIPVRGATARTQLARIRKHLGL
ncbi:MAG: hypothetical protein NTW87_07550 [Planctomycetota bacterium]|nr:hypothetical protein [Planctomycetota bacterium]